MQNTTNLKLKKPNLTDAINIDDFNYNADIIDAEIKKLLDSVGNLASLNTTQKTNLVGAINEVLGKFNSIKLEAENVTITDLENLFTATNVEGALSEVMKKANTNATSILSLEKNDGDLKTLKTTEKTNLVGAINELFQNANNGKSTIATAIGSPLLSGDTFGAMGTKINTLTQTFKNNLTAKGVAVGSSDKMSTLIDKVGSIELGKKWASGVVSTTYLSGDQYAEVVTDFGFTPKYIICMNNSSSSADLALCIYCDISDFNTVITRFTNGVKKDVRTSLNPILEYVSSNGFKLNVEKSSGYMRNVAWVAFE